MGQETAPLEMIQRIAIFPIIIRNDWLFRLSISDNQNIMLIMMRVKDPDTFMIRFFSEETAAIAFIEEAAEGKHLD